MSLINSLEIEEVTSGDNPNNSSFIFHHLPLGMGITIGNYLRRNILSNVGGIAPLGVKISDKNGCFIKSKFSSLEGSSEVAPYLIINLKEIVVNPKTEVKGVFKLDLKVENKSKEERIITAADFNSDDNIEIKNPNLYLTTLAPLSKIEIVLYFKSYLGYHRAEDQKDEIFSEDSDVIALDSDYSPIKGGTVNFQTRSVITSLSEEEEELTLTVETNGSIKPKVALLEVLSMSKELFNTIYKLVGESKIIKN